MAMRSKPVRFICLRYRFISTPNLNADLTIYGLDELGLSQNNQSTFFLIVLAVGVKLRFPSGFGI